MGRGGYRAGAGRKPTAVKYVREVARTEKAIAKALPELAQLLLDLARGGPPCTVEVSQPAGTITVATLGVDEKGKPVKGLAPAFPGLDPTTMVVVERRVTTPGPEVRAITYAMDRILGRPDVQAPPADDGDTPTARDVVAEMRAAGEAFAPDAGDAAP